MPISLREIALVYLIYEYPELMTFLHPDKALEWVNPAFTISYSAFCPPVMAVENQDAFGYMC